MEALIAKAKELLRSQETAFIIGYTMIPGTDRTRPFIAKTEADADKLVFNNKCVNNLAVYLTRIKKPKEGKMGIVAKGCDIRAVVALMQEQQIRREDVYIIGMACNGQAADTGLPYSAENLAPKCINCAVQTPKVYDFLIGEAAEYAKPQDKTAELMAAIDAMSPNERFAFWEAEFEKCIKCYACRQTCPLCYCEQCIADKTQPRWIESSPSVRGNFSWNMIRAFHLAGRCIGCGECDRACPMDIPLTLLNRKMGMIAVREFNYRHGIAIDEPTLVGSYNISDKEEFIK
jgi:ferredoxin